MSGKSLKEVSAIDRKHRIVDDPVSLNRSFKMNRIGVLAFAVVMICASFSGGCKKPTDCDVLADMVCAETTPEDCAGARKMAKNASEKEVKACGTFMKMIVEGRKVNKAKADAAGKPPAKPTAGDAAGKGAGWPVQPEKKVVPAVVPATGTVDNSTVKPAENKAPVPPPAEVPGSTNK